MAEKKKLEAGNDFIYSIDKLAVMWTLTQE